MEMEDSTLLNVQWIPTKWKQKHSLLPSSPPRFFCPFNRHTVAGPNWSHLLWTVNGSRAGEDTDRQHGCWKRWSDWLGGVRSQRGIADEEAPENDLRKTWNTGKVWWGIKCLDRERNSIWNDLRERCKYLFSSVRNINENNFCWLRRWDGGSTHSLWKRPNNSNIFDWST